MSAPVVQPIETAELQQQQYKPEKRRFFVLFTMAILTASVACQWICYAYIPNEVSSFFGCTDEEIDSLSSCYMFIFVALAFLACHLFEAVGMRRSLIIASVSNAVGSLLKVVAVLFCRQYGLLMVAQIFHGWSQCFVLPLPPLISGIWFPPSERALATTILVTSLNVGIALMMVVAPAIVTPEDGQNEAKFLYLFGWLAVMCVFPALVVPFLIPDAPDVAPSPSASRREDQHHHDRHPQSSSSVLVKDGGKPTFPSFMSSSSMNTIGNTGGGGIGTGGGGHNTARNFPAVSPSSFLSPTGMVNSAHHHAGSSVGGGSAVQRDKVSEEQCHRHQLREQHEAKEDGPLIMAVGVQQYSNNDDIREPQPPQINVPHALFLTPEEEENLRLSLAPPSLGGEDSPSSRSRMIDLTSPYYQQLEEEQRKAAARASRKRWYKWLCCCCCCGNSSVRGGCGPRRLDTWKACCSNLCNLHVIWVAVEMLRNLSFLGILLSSSAVIATSWSFTTLISQLLASFEVDEDSSGWMAFGTAIGGVILALAIGWVVDRKHVFKPLILGLAWLYVVFCTMMYVVLQFKPYFAGYFFFVIGGCFGYAIVPVALEHAIELTFPLPDSVSSTLIMAFASAISLVQISIAGACLGGNATHAPPKIKSSWTIAGMSAGCAFFALLAVPVRSTLKRREYEQCTNSATKDEEEREVGEMKSGRKSAAVVLGADRHRRHQLQTSQSGEVVGTLEQQQQQQQRYVCRDGGEGAEQKDNEEEEEEEDVLVAQQRAALLKVFGPPQPKATTTGEEEEEEDREKKEKNREEKNTGFCNYSGSIRREMIEGEDEALKGGVERPLLLNEDA